MAAGDRWLQLKADWLLLGVTEVQWLPGLPQLKTYLFNISF